MSRFDVFFCVAAKSISAPEVKVFFAALIASVNDGFAGAGL
ncbi:MAG: hypothetical protein WBD10_16205 [Acidobacteriaceae bacterium]